MNKLHKTSYADIYTAAFATGESRTYLQDLTADHQVHPLYVWSCQSSQFTQVHNVLLPSCSLSSAHIRTCVAYMWGFIPLNPHIGQSFSGSMEIATFGRLCQMCHNHCIIIILQTQLVSHLILYLLIHNSSSTRRHLSPGYL